MNILPSVSIPGPFGTLHTPALESPPVKLPTMPDAHGKEAMRYAIGQDIADLSDTLLDFIPGVDVIGAILDPVRDSIIDMHEKEILRVLSKEEYSDYLEYNKIFPRTIAMARTMCFKEAKSPKELGHGVGSLLPMSPTKGPPLPRVLNIKWPAAVTSSVKLSKSKGK